MGNRQAGDRNNGNTCFANAVVTILLSNVRVLQLLLRVSHSKTPPQEGSVLYELALLAREGWQVGQPTPATDHVVTSTLRLRRLVSEKSAEDFTDKKVHDPFIFFNKVLECDEELRALFALQYATSFSCVEILSSPYAVH